MKSRCRVCGRNTKGYTYDKNCDTFKALLPQLGFVVASDTADIHPERICNSCYINLKQGKDINTHTWLHHTDPCPLCTEGSQESLGGRPKKRRLEDVQPVDRYTKLLRVINSLDLPQFTHTPLNTAYFLPTPVLEDLTCKKCHCIPYQPVQLLPCCHLMCRSCISIDGTSCPCDDKANQVKSPSDLVVKLLGGLLVRCTQDCVQVMELKHLAAHLASNCTMTELPAPSNISVQHLLDTAGSSTPSMMALQTTGLLFDKVLPASGSGTWKTPSGKVSVW